MHVAEETPDDLEDEGDDARQAGKGRPRRRCMWARATCNAEAAGKSRLCRQHIREIEAWSARTADKRASQTKCSRCDQLAVSAHGLCFPHFQERRHLDRLQALIGADEPIAFAVTVTGERWYLPGNAELVEPGVYQLSGNGGPRRRGTCTELDCTDTVYAKGRCLFHYGAHRRRAAGIPARPVSGGPCTYSNTCPTPARVRGMCEQHYRLTLRTDPDGPKCTEDGCDRRATADGICKPHRYKRIEADPNTPRCGNAACDKGAVTGGYCRNHYKLTWDAKRRADRGYR